MIKKLTKEQNESVEEFNKHNTGYQPVRTLKLVTEASKIKEGVRC